MSGIVHLRIVVALFIVGGILSLLPYAFALFLDGVNVTPFGWAGGVASIAFALWLSRGSNIARNVLILFSILGLLFYGMLIFMILKDSWSAAVVLSIFGILSGYCLWALMFSRDVRAELARRSEKRD
jgi:hypothetical protein